MSDSFVPLPETHFSRTWRLGVTSYVYPADMASNLAMLAGRVDDVELVLFDTPAASNLPTPAEIAAMAQLAQERALTFTVHFPINHRLGSADRKDRSAMVRQMRQIIELTRPLKPHAYITHLEGIEPADPPDSIRCWHRECSESLRHVLEVGIEPHLLCVENLGYPYEWNDAIIDHFKLGVCIDIGHLWGTGVDVLRHLDRYLHRARVIHLHGEAGGQDHISLTYVDEDRMEPVMEALDGFAGVVTLEMFELMQVRNSISRLAAETASRRERLALP